MRTTHKAALMMGAAAFVVASVAGCEATETPASSDAKLDLNEYADVVESAQPRAQGVEKDDEDTFCFNSVGNRNIAIARAYDIINAKSSAPSSEPTGVTVPDVTPLVPARIVEDVNNDPKCFKIVHPGGGYTTPPLTTPTP